MMERVTGYSRAVMCVLDATDEAISLNCQPTAIATCEPHRFQVSVHTPLRLHSTAETASSHRMFWVSIISGDPCDHIQQPLEQVALYAFPVLWVGLLIIAIVKLNLNSVPTTILALIFNVTNVIGFTYA